MKFQELAEVSVGEVLVVQARGPGVQIPTGIQTPVLGARDL